MALEILNFLHEDNIRVADAYRRRPTWYDRYENNQRKRANEKESETPYM